jgi:ubiquinone/menaquinone biosynthesis C-methylase UbiE
VWGRDDHVRVAQDGGVAEGGVVGVAAEDYDAAHAAVDGSVLMRRLWSEAMGDQYPAEVEPFSSCTWRLLGQLVAALRLPPGGRLVDLGCGRGGPGLWLARALSADLVGIDFSPVAVELAARRASGFVGPGRAEFRRAAFDRTGLPDASVDAVVSVDALPFAADRVAALGEVRRILVPGRRVAATVRVSPGGRGDWPAMAGSVGLAVEDSLVNREHEEFWRRLHTSWLAHEPQLRAELGDRAAGNLIAEARRGLQQPASLPPHELLVLRRVDDI